MTKKDDIKFPEKYFSVFSAYGFSNYEEVTTTLEELKAHYLFDEVLYYLNILIGYEYSEERKEFSIVFYMPRKERLVKINIKINNTKELYGIYELIKKYYSYIRKNEIKEIEIFLEGS